MGRNRYGFEQRPLIYRRRKNWKDQCCNNTKHKQFSLQTEKEQHLTNKRNSNSKLIGRHFGQQSSVPKIITLTDSLYCIKHSYVWILTLYCCIILHTVQCSYIMLQLFIFCFIIGVKRFQQPEKDIDVFTLLLKRVIL